MLLRRDGDDHRTADSSLASRVHAARTLTLQRLLASRTPNGSWSDPLDVNGLQAAVYGLMLRTTGEINRPDAARDEVRLLRHMITQVNPDGGFYKYHGSPSCKPITRVAVTALRAAMGQLPSGHRPAAWFAANATIDEALGRAILQTIDRAEAFLRRGNSHASLRFELDHKPLEMLLAAHVDMDVYVPPVPVFDPEILARVQSMPSLEPARRQLNRLTWQFLPAVSILYRRLRRRNRFSRILLGILEGVPGFRQYQGRAINHLAMLIRDRQNENGGWVYNGLLTMLNVMALCEAGAPLDDPAVRSGMAYLRSTMMPAPGDGMFLDFISTDIWDTSAGAYAYLNIIGHTAMDGEIRTAIEFLLRWQSRNGGFAMASASRNDPDTDSTAFVLLCLATALPTARGPLRAAIEQALARGRVFLAERQDIRGGFSAWQSTFVDAKPGSQGVLKQALFDVATPDVTSRILHTMGRLGLTASDDSVRRAVAFLLRTQCRNGAWWSRWWAAYIPGTCFATRALNAIGLRYDGAARLSDPLLQRAHEALSRAIGFLVRGQNADGGWGETVLADVSPRHAGVGSSTPQHTALTVTALLHAGYPANDAVIHRGLSYLLDSAAPDGPRLSDPAMFTVIAGTFYYRYPFFGHTLSLIAFNEYLRRPDL